MLPHAHGSVASRSRFRSFGGLWLVATSAVAFACSSTTSNGTSPGNGSSTSTVPQETCASRCAPKFQGCGVPTEKLESGCKNLCASITEAQLTCIESKTCDELESTSSFDVLCPPPSPAAPSSGSTSTPPPSPEKPTEVTYTGRFDAEPKLISSDPALVQLFVNVSNATASPAFDPSGAGLELTLSAPEPTSNCKPWMSANVEAGTTHKLSFQAWLPMPACNDVLFSMKSGFTAVGTNLLFDGVDNKLQKATFVITQ